jgi:hypothetical protein
MQKCDIDDHFFFKFDGILWIFEKIDITTLWRAPITSNFLLAKCKQNHISNFLRSFRVHKLQ